jgi:hypothetical protein
MRESKIFLIVVFLCLLIPTPVSAETKSCKGWENAARGVGWKQSEIPQLSKIMYRESRCQPQVFNQNKRKDGTVWSKDLGLMQINDYSWRRWLKAQKIIKTDADLFVGVINLKAALAIWKYGENRHGNGWIAWKATSGS